MVKHVLFKMDFLNTLGVGKTSLVHLICQNEPTSNPNWTIGCSVDVKVSDIVSSWSSHCVQSSR